MKIYLAGGMGDLSFEEQNEWRKSLRRELQDDDTYVLNPVMFYNFEAPPKHKTNREVMEFDLHQVRTSDLIVVNFNDPHSLGTAMELAIARENKIPIIGLNDTGAELHPWLTEHCTRVCDSMSELVEHVKKFYIR